MTDLDFDELDKAVSSLLGGKSKKTDKQAAVAKSSAQTEPAAKKPIEVADPESKASPEPAEPQPESTPAPSAEPKPAAEQAPEKPAAKSVVTPRVMLAESAPQAPRGKFIDMIPRAPAASSSKPSRSGVALQPINPDIAPEEKPTVPATSPKEELPEPQKNEALVAAPKSEWPDPIDLHETSATDKTQQSQETPAESAVSQQSAEEELSQPSPFLPEAKVEKRPLGAFSAFADTRKEEEKPTTEQPPAQPEAPAAVEPEPISPVLTPEIMAVEAGEPMVNLEDQKEGQKPLADKKQKAAESSQPAATGLLPIASITQQYKSSDKPADAATHPIFDTKEYHPPLNANAGPKRSKTKAVVWTIVTLLIIVGLAVAGYYLYQYL